MADKPILFSAPMVKALLAGTKTQTRRALNPQPNVLNGGLPLNDGWGSYSTENGWRKYRIRIGDRLYVREHWRATDTLDHVAPRDMRQPIGMIYIADDEKAVGAGRFRQGMHMPRWASRLTLHVTEVRVQRLQDISDAEAGAEGVKPWSTEFVDLGDIQVNANAVPARTLYATLWDSINGAGSWDANPWVVAISFNVEKCNIASARLA